MTETWAQIIAFFVANASLIIWFRTESRADWRHIDAKTDAIRQEIQNFNEKLLKIESKNHRRRHYESNRRH